MAEQATPAADPSPSAMLGSILSNPELIKSISGILGNSANTGDTPQGADGLSGVLANTELMAKLPQIMAMLKPMLSGIPSADSTHAPAAPPTVQEAVPTSAPPSKRPPTDCRDELLLALKPFLSPGRCEAVDTIIRLSRLGSVLKHLQ